MDKMFILPQLKDPSRQIRILEILPGPEAPDTLHCEMTVHDLDSAEFEYTAISYTWGSPDPKKCIYINGLTVEVGLNCWYALWQVKNTARPKNNVTHAPQHQRHLYWIDALCINQADIFEKSVQVGMMDQVYTKAAFVAACIGESSYHDAQLFDEHFAWSWSLLSERQKESQRDIMMGLMDHLLQRPWFHRLWIAQECVLAKDIMIFCGNQCVRWRMLRVQLRWAERNYSYTQRHTNIDNFFRDIDNSQLPRGRIASPLSSVVQRYCMRECSQLHDKLYGLLSMVPDLERKLIPIDYHISLFELLCRYVEALCGLEIVGGEVRIRHGIPPSYGSTHYSIKSLVAQLSNSVSFTADMSSFWKWRLRGVVSESAETNVSSVITSSNVAHERRTTKIHCHKIDLRVDKVETINSKMFDVYADCIRTYFDERNHPTALDKQETWFQRDVIESLAQQTPQLLRTDCSDNPKYPGEMHFMLPAGARDGDWIVPWHYPEVHGSFHLLCRTSETKSDFTRLDVVGITSLIKRPEDSRYYMTWLMQKSEVQFCLRPYDILVLSYMENSGLQYIDLPKMEYLEKASCAFMKAEKKDPI